MHYRLGKNNNGKRQRTLTWKKNDKEKARIKKPPQDGVVIYNKKVLKINIQDFAEPLKLD